jgi:type II pantothenate kinase
MNMHIGVDAGGTLIKAAYRHHGGTGLRSFPVSELRQVAAWIESMDPEAVCVTGGKAAVLKSLLNRPAAEIVEFEATCNGVRSLLSETNFTEEAYIVTNVGTGTSLHHVQGHAGQRIGGTGVGGGTLMGLSRLLTGVTDYEQIVKLAAKGSRDRIDLLVRHIYEGSEPPIPGDLTASNFGNVPPFHTLQSYSNEELLASVIGLVGETVATVSVHAAFQCRVSTIVFIGSSFVGNEPLKDKVISYTKLRGKSPLFLENGQFSGALGALLAAELQ